MAVSRETMNTLPQVLIRDMTQHDVPAVMRIENASYPFPWSEGIFRDCLRVGYVCCVVEIDDILIGYGVMSTGAGEAHILNLCISEPFRARGLGAQMLEHLMEFAASLGVGGQPRQSVATIHQLFNFQFQDNLLDPALSD